MDQVTCISDENHWSNFESCRRKHNDSLYEETNKLVLRLDKYIEAVENGIPAKDVNKSLDIEWTPDDIEKRCPYCKKAFTITLRRHHCRLCGAILCNDCSGFLNYNSACKLVKPAKLYTDPYDRIEDKLKAERNEEKPNIRLCKDCKRMLDNRLRIIDDHYCQPHFLELYQKLRDTMDEADKLMLQQVSSTDQRSIVRSKDKLNDLRQSIASISAKFQKLAEKETNSKQAHLLKSIQQSVAHWLSERNEKKALRLSSCDAGAGSGIKHPPD